MKFLRFKILQSPYFIRVLRHSTDTHSTCLDCFQIIDAFDRNLSNNR